MTTGPWMSDLGGLARAKSWGLRCLSQTKVWTRWALICLLHR